LEGQSATVCGLPVPCKEIIRADYSIERPVFLSSRLALRDKVIDASINTKQNSSAVGALKLQAQLIRLFDSNHRKACVPVNVTDAQ